MEDNKNGYDMPFPTRLRSLLEESGISQQELADFVGVKRQTVAQWKDGKTAPDVYNFQKIAEYFKLPYEYLLGESDSKVHENMILAQTLGLSDQALEKLKRWAGEGDFVQDLRRSEIVSQIISHDAFDELVRCVGKSCREYISYRNADGEIPSYSLPAGAAHPTTKYAVEGATNDFGKSTVNAKEMSDFYRYQSSQLYNEIVGYILEEVYNEDYLHYHYEQ